MQFFLISQGNGEGQLQEVSRPPRLQHQRRALLHHVLLDEHLQETGEEEGGREDFLKLWPTYNLALLTVSPYINRELLYMH